MVDLAGALVVLADASRVQAAASDVLASVVRDGAFLVLVEALAVLVGRVLPAVCPAASWAAPPPCSACCKQDLVDRLV